MKYRFAEMIWYEIKEAAEQERVAVLPVATYEDHGPHLPVDVDVVLCTGICERAVAKIPSEAVLAPAVPHGYSPHHMDIHGTLTITWDVFIKYVRDVCCSLAHHCFKRILVVNGHGSNTSPLDMATRLSNIEYEGKILCATVNHWDVHKIKVEGARIRDSDHGGAGHAGEYETSLDLAMKPDLVEMDKAVDERSALSTRFRSDLILGSHPEGSNAKLIPYWSSHTASGVVGDAKKATVEKGEKFLKAAVDGVVELIRELKQQEILPRRDRH